MTRASHLLHAAVGHAAPCDSYGRPIPQRGSGGPCAACGAPGAYTLDDMISENFTTVKNDGRAWPHGGTDVCAACVFAARTLALRCSGWFATPAGVCFYPTWPAEDGAPRPDVLAQLLDPPAPPFVAAYPAAGVAHGGDRHRHRCWWPGRPMAPDPLIRLQSKHVAMYARVATSRERYPLQVDDLHDVVVDVPLWRRLRAACDALLADLRRGGVGARECSAALVSLRPPGRAPLEVLAAWRDRVAPLAPHHGAPWWSFFVDWLIIPPLPGRPKENP